ncbi:MAG: hypothetical protein AABY68_01275 [Pseudomonadota bacterium]
MNRYIESGDNGKTGKEAGIHESVPQRALAIRFFESMQESWRIGAVLALIVLVVGIPMAFVKGKSYYGSTAVVHVNPRFLRNLTEDVEQQFQSNTQYRQYVQQQVSTLSRLDVAYETLERLGDNETAANPALRPKAPESLGLWETLKSGVKQWLSSQRREASPYLWRNPGESPTSAAWRLLLSIQAVPVSDTYLINVSIESDHPEHLARVLNMYVEVFLERSRNEEFYGMDQRLGSLAKRQKELELLITNALRRRAQIAQDLGVTTFSDGNLNPFDALIIDGTRALDEVRRKRLQNDSTVTVYVDRGADGILNSLAEEQVGKDYGMNALRANLGKRRGDILSQISGLEPSHPLRLAGELEISEIDRELAGQSGLVSKQQKRIIKERYIAEADQARELESKMIRELTSMRSRASWYAQHYQDALRLQGDVDRARAELSRIDERVGGMRLESEAPGFVHWSSHAVQDYAPISGGKTKWLMIVLLLSLAVFIAVPLLITALDRRITTPRALHNILGFAPMGWLALQADDRLIAYNEDLLLRIGIRLRKDHEQHGTRSFAFMGAKSNVGVTPLVFDLAKVLQQMHLRVAVVELDALTRSARYPRDNERDINALLNACLRGEKPEIAPGDQQIWTLSLPSSAKKVPNLGVIKAALDLIAAHVDIILIDSSPLLLSADSEVIAAEVDCAIMVARAGHCLKNDIDRASNLLERANPPSVAVLMTDVRVDGVSGYLVDDAREKLGLPPAQGLLARIKAILDDPMLLSVMMNAWWMEHRERMAARVEWVLTPLRRWQKRRGR